MSARVTAVAGLGEAVGRPTAEAQVAARQLADLARNRDPDARNRAPDRNSERVPEIALVLGSGWAGVVNELIDPGSEVTVAMSELPGFHRPSAAGHLGTVTSATVDGCGVLAFVGRTHLYEGVGFEAVTHAVHVAAASGIPRIVLSNAAGGLRPEMAVGDLVLIADHINLTGRSPLQGAQFVDLVDAYSPGLRTAAATAIHAALDERPAEGVYAQMPGPQYETPAEIRMLSALGADLVGMSTVPETIAARALGMEVVAMSLVTNLAAGITGEKLDHTEVLAAGLSDAGRLAKALRAALPAVARTP